MYLFIQCLKAQFQLPLLVRFSISTFADRPRTLWNKTCERNARPTFCTSYTPYLPASHIRRVLSKHWRLRGDCCNLCIIFPEKPKLAFRTHKSIKQALVRARVEESYEHHNINRDLRVLPQPLPMTNMSRPYLNVTSLPV